MRALLWIRRTKFMDLVLFITDKLLDENITLQILCTISQILCTISRISCVISADTLLEENKNNSFIFTYCCVFCIGYTCNFTFFYILRYKIFILIKKSEKFLIQSVPIISHVHTICSRFFILIKKIRKIPYPISAYDFPCTYDMQ